MSEDAHVMLPSRSAILWFVAAIAAACFVIYGKALFYGFVTFDDDVLIFNNPIVQSFTPAHIVYVFTHFDPELYIPLTFLSYMTDWSMGGGSAFPFHLTNLLLHIGNACLVGLFVWLLSKKKFVALFCAALFAVHPLNTEAVLWLSGRKDLLSTLFFLISLCTYLFFTERKTTKMYVLSLGSFFLGLLSKVIIFPLPIILLLIDVFKGRTLRKDVIIEKIPYFLLSLIFGTVAMVGKEGVVDALPFSSYLLIAPRSLLLTLHHALFPTTLSVLYPFTHALKLSNPELFVPILLSILLVILFILFLRKNRNAAFGMGFFLIMLLPSFLTLYKNGSLYVTSDRYAYIPLIGLLFLLGSFIDFLLLRFSKKQQNPLLIFLFLLICVVLGIASFERATVWKNTLTLFTDAIAKAPDSSLAHNKVGSQLLDNGDIDAAEKEFRTSISLTDNPRAHYNLGLVYLSRNNLTEAYNENIAAIRLSPEYAPAHVNLGYLLWQSGKMEDAITHFKIAIENEANNVDARLDLAIIYKSEGKNAEAQKLAEEILAIDPKNADAMSLLQ